MSVAVPAATGTMNLTVWMGQVWFAFWAMAVPGMMVTGGR